MNRPLIQKIIDVLEGRIEPVEKLGFDMAAYAATDYGPTGHACGTTACIGGWAIALSHPSINSAQDLLNFTLGNAIEPVARRALGLRESQADRLFYARRSDHDLSSITRKQAAKVLKHLLKTGAVDWSVA